MLIEEPILLNFFQNCKEGVHFEKMVNEHIKGGTYQSQYHFKFGKIHSFIKFFRFQTIIAYWGKIIDDLL